MREAGREALAQALDLRGGEELVDDEEPVAAVRLDLRFGGLH